MCRFLEPFFNGERGLLCFPFSLSYWLQPKHDHCRLDDGWALIILEPTGQPCAVTSGLYSYTTINKLLISCFKSLSLADKWDPTWWTYGTAWALRLGKLLLTNTIKTGKIGFIHANGFLSPCIRDTVWGLWLREVHEGDIREVLPVGVHSHSFLVLPVHAGADFFSSNIS